MEIMIAPNHKLIGDKIREAREKAGYTQAQFGELMDKSQAAIVKLERGEMLTIDNLYKLSEILGYPVAWFLGIGTGQLTREEVELLELFRDLPKHQSAILDILRGLHTRHSKKNGNGNGL